MARKRRVTRTIKSKQVEYLAIDKNSMETFNGIVNVPYETKDEKLEKVVREAVNTDDVKMIDIINVEVAEEYRGMDEDFFIKNSYVINDKDSDNSEAEAE